MRRAVLLGSTCLVVAACVDALDLSDRGRHIPLPGAFPPAAEPVVICSEGGATFRRKVVVDPSRVAGDLVEFPVLVSVGADPLLASTSNGGHVRSAADLHFRSASGELLAHDLEGWDAAGGGIDAWVRMPLLSSVDATDFWLCYGSELPSPSDPSVVWSAYRGVWHLSQSPDGAAPQMLDSSPYGNHGTAYFGVSPASETGVIANGLDLDGGDDGVSVEDAPSLRITTSGLSVSAWIRPDVSFASMDPNTRIVDRWTSNPTFTGFYFYVDASTNLAVALVRSDGTQFFSSDTQTFTAGVFRHVAFVWRPSGGTSTVSIYVDGLLVDTETEPVTRLATSAQTLTLGANLSNESFNGLLDEVRIGQPLSSEWIATEHATVVSAGVFALVGAEEIVE